MPGFALLSYAAALEPLRQANRLSGRPLYEWRHLSPGGTPVTASSGTIIAADADYGNAGPLDLLVLCAATGARHVGDPALLQWLRGLALAGRTEMVALSGAAYLLARAGLLDNRRVTLHWEDMPALREEFPKIDVTGHLFERDQGRATCAGGVSTLDLMHAIIAAAHGVSLATAVTERFLHPGARPGTTPQRMDLRARLGISHPRLLKVLAYMEAHPEEPADPAALAALGALSVRQMERLFRRHLGRTMREHSRALRLDRARQLLRGTTLPVLDVAVACGFVSVSHFSRVYRQMFGHPPLRDRGAAADVDQLAEGRQVHVMMSS
jgi:transcriptional regulator GlxA family with amidase domain